MNYLGLLIILCIAIFYYRLGEAEYRGGWLLALGSVALWAVGVLALHWGLLGNLLLQAGLFIALWIWNMRRSNQP